MNNLQRFIEANPYLTDKTITQLAKIEPLCQVLVRCGQCRFTAGAQYIPHLVKCIEAGKDYVRDVSFPVGSMAKAAGWFPNPQALADLPKAERRPTGPDAHQQMPRKSSMVPFDESQCGGVFDGIGTVTSDADSGL